MQITNLYHRASDKVGLTFSGFCFVLFPMHIIFIDHCSMSNVICYTLKVQKYELYYLL